jgi:hypothetical protein
MFFWVLITTFLALLINLLMGSLRSSFSPALYFEFDTWLEVSMCGRFAQAQTREKYLAYLADEADRDMPFDPEPIGR